MKVTLTNQQAAFLADSVSAFNTPRDVYDFITSIQNVVDMVGPYTQELNDLRKRYSEKFTTVMKKYLQLDNNGNPIVEDGKYLFLEGKSEVDFNSESNEIQAQLSKETSDAYNRESEYEITSVALSYFGALNVEKTDYVVSSQNQAQARSLAVSIAYGIYKQMLNSKLDGENNPSDGN